MYIKQTHNYSKGAKQTPTVNHKVLVYQPVYGVYGSVKVDRSSPSEMYKIMMITPLR